MHTTWYSLAWKEWNEHKWKLAAIVATMAGVLLGALLYDDRHDFTGAVIAACGVCIVPLSVFIGLGAAANERSRRTLPFLQALPATLWQIAVLKLLLGLITLFIPILLMTLVAYAEMQIAPAWRTDALQAMAMYFPFTASLFIWSAAAGVNRKDEVGAAAVSLSAIVAFPLMMLAIAFLCWSPYQPPMWFLIPALAAGPGGVALLFSNNEISQYHTVSVILWLLFHGLICAWYINRFGRVTNREVRSPSVSVAGTGKPAWLPPPRHTTLSATAWKQFRESGPIVLCGLAGAVAVTIAIIVGCYFDQHDAIVLFDSGTVHTKVAVIMSFFIALVLGIGVCPTDMDPQINTFWRTRPINPDLWFWTKFGTGLALLLAATYLPNMLLASFGVAKVSADMTTNPYLLAIAQIAVFASAVAITCLVRHAIYAAILTIPLVYFGAAVVWFAVWLSAHLHSQPRSPNTLMELSDAQLVCGFLLTFCLSTLMAWLAMRNDWGRKSRY